MSTYTIKCVAIVIYSLRYENHGGYYLNTSCCKQIITSMEVKSKVRNEILREIQDEIRKEYSFADGGITIYCQDLFIKEGDEWIYLGE